MSNKPVNELNAQQGQVLDSSSSCLLYTYDAADEG